MVALKLQQFQKNLKKMFFGAGYFLCSFVKVHPPPPHEDCKRGGGG